ncbi:MAG TPA: hypothetical protein VJT09_19700 [Pyrinomonadaceae bacterium]|nr:hypothetical protein [Pyrinomonadaceae bacterium]
MLSIQVKSLRFKWPARHVRVATAMVLVLSLLMILPHSVNLARAAADNSTGPERTPEKKVKTVKGDSVRRHVEKLRLKNKGLERAMREFARKGLTPRWEDSLSAVQVPETASADRPVGLFQRAAYQPPQDTYTQDGNEITFITYSGDLSYWDGIVYVHTPYQDDTYSGDFLTPTDDGSNWNVVNEVYYPPDGGSPCTGDRACMEQEQQVSKPTPGHKQKAERKANSFANHSAAAARPGLWGWLKSWWGCVTSFCSFSYQVCSGVNYRFLCRVALCVYGLWGCL